MNILPIVNDISRFYLQSSTRMLLICNFFCTSYTLRRLFVLRLPTCDHSELRRIMAAICSQQTRAFANHLASRHRTTNTLLGDFHLFILPCDYCVGQQLQFHAWLCFHRHLLECSKKLHEISFVATVMTFINVHINARGWTGLCRRFFISLSPWDIGRWFFISSLFVSCS